MATFLSVKEAAKITGKSPSSIRRIIYPILHDDAHADRLHIQPSVDDVMQMRMKGENFAWQISEELLHRELPDEPANSQGSSTAKSMGSGEGELLAMLRGELQIKNQQISQQSELISKQMQLINGLSERLREGNVLMGSLQQHLALPQGRTDIQRGDHQPINATAASTKAEKGSSVAVKTSKHKKGFLGRLFR